MMIDPKQAQRFLTDSYNDFVKGRGYVGIVEIAAQSDLYDAFVATIQTIERLVDDGAESPDKRLLFKNARMNKLDEPGWKATFHLTKEYEMEGIW